MAAFLSFLLIICWSTYACQLICTTNM
jgi:hypothetical protein